jgi:ubiquitin-conjugating enzyme E2 O
LTTTGLIEVVLPHGEMVQVPLERVTLLNNEGLDELGVWPDDNMSMSEEGSFVSEEVMEEVLYPDGEPPAEEEADGWETEGSEQEGKDDDMQSAESEWGDEGDKDPEMNVPGGPIPISPSPPPPAPGPSTNPSGGSILDTLDESTSPWHRFEILPAAPADHAYYAQKTTSAQPPKAFMIRLTKEFKVLASSLPSTFSCPSCSSATHTRADTILVRAYEDRSDLLRCLIIGPQNTPYEDAPFVIDWFLDSSFPQTPPQAHFMSWTNGNGRGAFCVLFAWTGLMCVSS